MIVDAMIRYENAYPYVIGLVLRATKNIVDVPVEHRKRETGTSGYTLKNGDLREKSISINGDLRRK